jgi:hypothetical protein
MSEVPAGWYPHPYHRGQDLYWDGSSWTADARPSVVASVEASTPREVSPHPAAMVQPARPRKAWMALTLIPMALVLAIGGVLMLVVRTSSPEATVAKALAATLALRSADVTIDGSAHIEGINAPITGSGAFSFTQNAGSMTLRVSAAGEHLTEKVVNDHQHVYINLGPALSKILPVKSWISMPIVQTKNASGLGTGSAGSTDPGAVLNILGRGESKVTPLGSSTLNGVPVQGYLVLVNSAEIKREENDSHLPEWLRQEAAVVRDEKVGYKVYVDSSGTVYRLTSGNSEQVGAQAVDEYVTMDFSRFGTSIEVTAPPANQVTSYAVFLKDLKAAESQTES